LKNSRISGILLIINACIFAVLGVFVFIAIILSSLTRGHEPPVLTGGFVLAFFIFLAFVYNSIAGYYTMKRKHFRFTLTAIVSPLPFIIVFLLWGSIFAIAADVFFVIFLMTIIFTALSIKDSKHENSIDK
jgi:hypothetical protein